MHFLTYDVKRETDGRSVSRRTVSVIAGSLLIITLLLFAGCERDDADSGAPSPAATPAVALEAPKGLIKADPNPVPAGPGALGKTTISWNTGSNVPADISVSSDGQPEIPFAGGVNEGKAEAPWIQAGASYDFRLYLGTGANKKLIDHVTVTRSK